MKLPVLNADGKELRRVDVDESVFGIEPNGPILHQAFVAGRANQRWGTANTKTRGEVQGSTKKIRMQKYTGRSRQGSIRAPHHVGGGVVFGPRQRSYAKDLPKKMRRLAIRSALSGKVADGQLVVIDQLAFKVPKTKEMIRILKNVGIERSTLVVTGATDRTVLASIRNLEKTKLLPAAYLNVVDMMNHRSILITEDALRVAEQLWGSKEAAVPRKAKAAAVKPKAAPAARHGATPKAVTAPAAAPEKPVHAPKAAAKPEPVAKAPAAKGKAAPVAAKPAGKAPAAEAKAPTVAAEPVAKAPAAKAKAPTVAAKPAGKAPAAKPASKAKAAPGDKPKRRTKKTEGEEA